MLLFFTKLYNNKQTITLILLSVIFFIVYAWFPAQTALNGVEFASPDEHANYFWIGRVAHGEALEYFEPLNVIADDAVVPRSVRSDNGVVKPVSFLGIILIYGTIAKLLGMWIVPLLTPLFAVVGVLFFYGIFKKIFNKRTALFSALLFFAFAPYWYYASRGLFHNVLFVDLVLAGIWLSLRGMERSEMTKQSHEIRGVAVNTRLPRPEYSGLAMTVMSGIIFGLAIMTRVSELIWLGPAGVIIAAAYCKKINWRKAILFIAGLLLALTPMLYYNHQLYGSVFSFGYAYNTANISQQKNNEIAALRPESLGTPLAMTKAALPFGFHPRAVWRNFINYYVKIFWYLFWPAFLGGILFLWKWKEKSKAQKIYFSIFVVISMILGIYYGSWNIQDSIALNPITIGNSYTRYWLPMYILSLPLLAGFVLWLIKFFKNKYARNAVLTLLVVAFGLLNARAAVFSKGEGLYYAAQNIALDKERAAQALALVPEDAVIATKYFDKYFWPERKVVSTDLSDARKNQAIAVLLQNEIPVYYYGFIFAPGDFAYMNNVKFRDAGIELEIIMLDEKAKLGLYKITRAK